MNAWNGVATLAASILAGQSATAEDFFYRVDAGKLACIVAHADAYLAFGADPVLVVPDDCPPQAEAKLDDLLTNEAPDLNFAEDGALDPLLVLDPSSLRCLADVALPTEGQVLRLYPDSCRVEADGG